MKTIKIAEATEAQIDYLVAKEEGYDCQFDDEVSGPWLAPREGYLHDEKPLSRFRPSTDYDQGMPILERKRIGINPWANAGEWQAKIYNSAGRTLHMQFGPSMLIAGLRCFLASKLGDTVEIPEELL